MLTLDTIVIGRRSMVRSFIVSEQAIRDFALSIGDLSLLYHNTEFARSQGYKNIIAPPTFATVFGFNRIPGLDMPLAPLEVPLPGIIYLDQEFVYGRTIVAGDTVMTEGWVSDVKLRGKGGMTTLYLASEGRDQDQCVVFQACASFLIPPVEE